jgi:hypothetical protein
MSYAHASEDLSRFTGFGAATSSRGVDNVDGALQLTDSFHAGATLIAPKAGVLVSYLSGAAFQEADNVSQAFALSGAAAQATTLSPFAAVDISRDFAGPGDVAVTPAVELGYRYDAAATGMAQTLTAADGTAFLGNRLGLDRSSALLGVSLSAHQGHWSGFVRYDAQVAGDWNDQSLQAGFRITF